MKRYFLLTAVLLSLTVLSCKRTFVCECGDSATTFEEKARYDDEKEAESGCYTTEVNLQAQNPNVNCRVTELD